MNEQLLLSYLPILIFLIIAAIFATILGLVPFIIGPKFKSKSSVSAYECGFEAFGRARAPFDVRFYLVSILFIIFDLEIAFLFPWAIVLNKLPLIGFLGMMFFLTVLSIGFIYEWKRGALEWK